MRRPRLTTRGLMAAVAAIGGCFAIARIQPWLVAWLVLLVFPVASWTALQFERSGHDGPSASRTDRLVTFLDALLWCVSVIVALLVAMILVAPWFGAVS